MRHLLKLSSLSLFKRSALFSAHSTRSLSTLKSVWKSFNKLILHLWSFAPGTVPAALEDMLLHSVQIALGLGAVLRCGRSPVNLSCWQLLAGVSCTSYFLTHSLISLFFASSSSAILLKVPFNNIRSVYGNLAASSLSRSSFCSIL